MALVTPTVTREAISFNSSAARIESGTRSDGKGRPSEIKIARFLKSDLSPLSGLKHTSFSYSQCCSGIRLRTLVREHLNSIFDRLGIRVSVKIEKKEELVSEKTTTPTLVASGAIMKRSTRLARKSNCSCQLSVLSTRRIGVSDASWTVDDEAEIHLDITCRYWKIRKHGNHHHKNKHCMYVCAFVHGPTCAHWLFGYGVMAFNDSFEMPLKTPN